MSGLSLVFRADVHLCAVQLGRVVEVMRPLPVRRVVGGVSFLSGVCVIRGAPVPVVSMGALLGGEARPPSRFVTVDGGGRPVALAVDEVLGVRDVPTETLPKLSPLLAAAKAECVASLSTIDAEPLFLLDDARLVPDSVWLALLADRKPP
jgi:purine-binding chemotaxis protein CheW